MYSGQTISYLNKFLSDIFLSYSTAPVWNNLAATKNIMHAKTNNMTTPAMVSIGVRFPTAFRNNSGIGAVGGKKLNAITTGDSGLVTNNGAAYRGANINTMIIPKN